MSSGAGGVAGVGAAQEAEAVGQDFQHAVGKDLFAGLGALLMMANISSCLRMRPTFSISSASACFKTSDTCSALSSLRCMEMTPSVE
jgi:hypothetical protein